MDFTKEFNRILCLFNDKPIMLPVNPHQNLVLDREGKQTIPGDPRGYIDKELVISLLSRGGRPVNKRSFALKHPVTPNWCYQPS
ncbi:MAG: hypothetical protein KKC68_07765 [Candidatus Thermoplasmatota archaeon]|nr:hypothetical protein [Candidatus Thermoplasmatota archaeon]MBU1941654.1 hypothetical protein [Candidatus Thermoplasmatota archaeon]